MEEAENPEQLHCTAGGHGNEVTRTVLRVNGLGFSFSRGVFYLIIKPLSRQVGVSFSLAYGDWLIGESDKWNPSQTK